MPRNVVRLVLRDIDSEGVESRRRRQLRRRQYFSRGPSYVWHIDGYDKLKPYGFSIHGAIDGFSRRILWIELLSSNKDPNTIVSLYLDYVRQFHGLPRKIVADCGTENLITAGCQRYLRREQTDTCAGAKSFQYGRSVSNQRIEALWSQLRRSCTNFWIGFFKDLIESGLFDTSSMVEKQCILFVFSELLQQDLKAFSQSWNSHSIRPSANTDITIRPSGRPNVLYFSPELTDRNACDYKIPLNYQDLSVMTSMYQSDVTAPKYLCSMEMLELAAILMSENDLQMAQTPTEGLKLYQTLLQLIGNI